MSRRVLGFVVLAFLAVTLPGALHAVLHIEGIHETPADFDHRAGTVAPSPGALALAAAHSGVVRWNRFGTVHLMFNPDGFLAGGLAGDPATAAREWIRQNRALFALSEAGVDALDLVRDSRLEGGSARVLLFGQVIDGTPVMREGRIKIGVVDGNLFWVASSSIGEAGSLAAPALVPEQAWANAAAGLGLGVSLGNLVGTAADGEWTALAVDGLSHPQRVRLGALGIPGAGAIPAYEVLSINLADGALVGYSHFVDAVTGNLVAGFNRARQLLQPDAEEKAGELPAQPHVFAGSYPPGQVGQCGPCEGPFTADAAEAWEQLVIVAHHLAGGDITFNVYRDAPGCDANLVLSQDLLTTPEQSSVSPVAPGDYYVEVCPFDPDTNLVSGDYAGTATFQKTGALNDNPKWRFFPAYPRLDFASTDIRELGCWFDEDANGNFLTECEHELAAGSSHGITWDYDPTTGQPSETTTGNAARSSEAWGAFLSGGGPYQPVVASADPADHRVYDFPWTNQWFESACNPAVITHSGGLLPDADVDAAIANLFAQHNLVHDWAYHLGYRERQGGAQLDNFGQTSATAENDFELGNAQAGALTGGWPSYTGRDNANQLATPDGVPPLSNMYLWQTIGGAIYVPCVDGDFDGGVIAHEYGHLIQHRMVDPLNGLNGDIGGAMGESWSDLTAIGILNEYSRVPVTGENPFAIGAYVTDPVTGIRNFAMNNSPLNHGNVGYDFVCQTSAVDNTCLNVTQFHADGEIWSATNFDLRQALVAKYDGSFPSGDAALQKRCADGQVPSDLCPGNRRWSQIMHDAFLLMPNAPSMVDARDAYLAADLARANDPVLSWPSNAAELWGVFARRGLGQNAAAVDGDDFDPLPDFSSPLAANATATFELFSDETKAPIVGEVFVGRFEARSNPLVDTDGGTALPATRQLVAGTYDFVARADGYGHHRFQVTLGAGQVRTVKVFMATNWASASQGASAAGAGSGHGELLDDTEATNWERLGAVPSVDLEKPTVTVTLNGVHRVNRVQVSGMLEVFEGQLLQNRFSSVHGFRVLACNAALLNCSLPLSFTEILNAPDAFPSADLRPLVRDVTARSFATAVVDATHLRFEVLHNKCTGTAKYHGYLGIPGNLDADPNNRTDCRTGVPGAVAARNVDVRVAELQVFGRTGKVQVVK